MKNKFALLISLVMVILMSSCSSVFVKVDYDSTKDFSKYRTFKYIKQKNVDNDREIQNDLNRKRFALAIEKELTRKGFERVTDTKPDFKIVYHLRFEKKLDISAYSYRYYPGIGMGERIQESRVYEEGSVIIDIIDSEENQLIWRGSAEGVLNEYTDAEELINTVVKEILKKFPPSVKK